MNWGSFKYSDTGRMEIVRTAEMSRLQARIIEGLGYSDPSDSWCSLVCGPHDEAKHLANILRQGKTDDR